MNATTRPQIHPWLKHAFAPIALYLVASGAFLWLVPAFEAPDENSHYEYSVLMSRLGRVPLLRDRDLALVDEVSRLMVERGHGLRLPGPGGVSAPIFNPELGRQPPGYYVVPSLLTTIFHGSIDAQVRIMRLWSVFLGLIVVVAAVIAGRRLAQTDWLAGAGLPLIVASLPGFTFISGTLNNDNLSNAATAVLFAVATIAIGTSSWRRWIGLAVGALVVGAAAKRTALTVVPGIVLIALAEGMGRLTRRSRAIALPVLALFVLLAIPFAIAEDDGRPIGWNVAPAGTATRSGEGLLGTFEFRLRASPTSSGRISQTLAGLDLDQGSDAGISAFAWMRAAGPGESIGGIQVTQGGIAKGASAAFDGFWRPVRVHFVRRGPEPVRVAFVADRGAVRIDGAVVAAGDRRGVPVADTSTSIRGIWDGRPFLNQLTNASAEVPRYGLRRELAGAMVASGVPFDALDAVLSTQAWPSIDGPRSRFLAWFAFQSFIGRFGWLVLPMEDQTYQACIGIGLLALAGLVMRFVRGAAARRWILIAGTIVGSAALLAVGPFIVGVWGDEWPQGRYLYPALLPIAMLMSLGLSAWVPRRHAAIGLLVLAAMGFSLQAIAILGTIVPHYRG